MQKEKWISDPAHSELSFKIRHLMISNVTGSIQQFEVTAETQGEDFTNANISLTADLHSISTNNEQRDTHLRSADFFDVERYPQLTFISTGIEKTADDQFVITGELTLKEITKPVILQVQAGGIIRSAERGTKAGFTITTSINRSDWGSSFKRVLDFRRRGAGRNSGYHCGDTTGQAGGIKDNQYTKRYRKNRPNLIHRWSFPLYVLRIHTHFAV